MKGDPLETFEKFAKKSLTKPKTTIGMIGEKIYIFLKSIRLKSHSAEKPKKRSFRPIKRFLQTENFKKMQGVPFDDIRKFSKKSQNAERNPKEGPFGLTCCTFGSIKILWFSARIELLLCGFRNLVEDEQQNR